MPRLPRRRLSLSGPVSCTGLLWHEGGLLSCRVRTPRRRLDIAEGVGQFCATTSEAPARFTGAAAHSASARFDHDDVRALLLCVRHAADEDDQSSGGASSPMLTLATFWPVAILVRFLPPPATPA